MCGLLACVDRDPGTSRVEAAMRRLRARGPDGSYTWRSPSGRALLGHARLAINDPTEAGRQPMVSADGLVGLVCNGEIYNAPALRTALERDGARFTSRCDVEVLLHARELWGLEETLRRVHGMYALAVWDDRLGLLEAAVDHAGMKPLAFAAPGDSILLASGTDALVDLLGAPPDLDPTSLCHVLCHGHVPPPRTIWQGVGKLGPGRAMRWTASEGAEHATHWSPPERIEDGPADALAERECFESVWEAVVADHLLSDEPVGLFLSGGLDSTCVALALARAGRRDVRALTLALDGPDDESAHAASVAAHLGLAHETVPFGTADARQTLLEAGAIYDEPQAYGALLTATRLARAARAHARVMLAGDGGDEAFAGYTWHRAPPATPAPRRDEHAALAREVADPDAPGRARAGALDALATLSPTHAHLQRVFPRFHPAEAAALFERLSPRYDEHAYASWATEHDRPEMPWPRRAQRLDLSTFCAGSILPKIDRASMGVGLEVRAPMLDRRVLDFALARPVRDEESDAAGARPTVRDYLRGRVPDGVLARRKQGFSLRLADPDPWSPMAPWLDRSRLVRDGVLRRDWRGFVQGDAPFAPARTFALCFLAAWYEERA